MQEEKEKTKEHEYCLRCGRKLKNPNTRILGYGIVCYKKQRAEQIKNRLF